MTADSNTSNRSHRWPIGIRLEVLPGNTILERFESAERFGFDAVELPGRHLDSYRDELLACKDRLPLPISSLSLGFECSLVGDDDAARQRCKDSLLNLFAFCSEVGAANLVMPPLLKQDGGRLPMPSRPMPERCRAADDLLVQQLPDLARAAADHTVRLLLEPVNRFESDYMHRLDHAFEVCQKVNHPNLGITADVFHMQLEELHPASSLCSASKWIGHVHLAENTRVEPGPGSLDLTPIFRALREMAYEGCVVVECRTLSGAPETVLPRCAKHLRRFMQDAFSAQMQTIDS